MPYPDSEPNFLQAYFLNVYRKLEADALLYNRRLPHRGLAGAENEHALAGILRDFLPPQYGIETSGIVIDRHGRRSRQCDIIIYDAITFPRYFRKVYPAEVVYGTIEVKTSLTSSEAAGALTNLESVAALEFRPELTPFWRTRTAEDGLRRSPPFGVVFGYSAVSTSYETFSSWFPHQAVLEGIPLVLNPPAREVRVFLACSLDKGIIKMGSSDGHVVRWIPTYEEPEPDSRSVPITIGSNSLHVDPVKALFLFLESLWQVLSSARIHPGFDIRSYMGNALGIVVDANDYEP